MKTHCAILLLFFASPLLSMETVTKKQADSARSALETLKISSANLNQNDVRLLIRNKLLANVMPCIETHSVTPHIMLPEMDQFMFEPHFIGESVAVADNASVKLFDLLSGRLVRTILTEDVESYAVHSSGMLATASDCIKIWSSAGESPSKVFYNDPQYAFPMLSFNRLGTHIAAASGIASVWDVGAGICSRMSLPQVQNDPRDGNYHCVSVDFDAAGKVLLTGHFNGTVGIWSTSNGRCLKYWQAHACQNGLDVCAFNNAGNRVLTCVENQTKVWEASGRRLVAFSGESCSFNKTKGLFIVRGADRRSIPVVSIDSLKVVLKLHHDADFEGFNFSESGRYLAASSDDNLITIWSMVTGKCVHILRGCTIPPEGVYFDSSEDKLVSTEIEGLAILRMRIWSLTGLWETLKALTDEQTFLLHAVHELIVLHRLIKYRAAGRGARPAVQRNDGSIVSADDISHMRLDLGGNYAHLREAYNALPENLKKFVSPYILYSLEQNNHAACPG